MKPDHIRERLRRLGREPRAQVREFRALEEMFEQLAPAAVLVPLTEVDGRMDVVLTKRSRQMRNHPGQVSFPGGRMDQDDGDLIRTALRESVRTLQRSPRPTAS